MHRGLKFFPPGPRHHVVCDWCLVEWGRWEGGGREGETGLPVSWQPQQPPFLYGEEIAT